IHQLHRPGAPFVFGYGNSPMDLKTVQAAYAHPIGMQTQGGMCDMARYYNLPTWGEAGHGCSKLCDEQAAQEGMFTILMAAMQGCNITHDVGYNNFGLGFSFETLVMNDNAIGMVKEVMKGVEVNEDTLSVDVIKKAGYNGDFLRTKHTREGARTMWRGDLSDFFSYQDWLSQGATSMGERVHAKVERILANHPAPALPQEIDAQIESIIEAAREKAATLD
ncbi:MAG: trimethylamine methyltransferase family protein, partial [Clostridiales bacterium]